MDHLQYWKHDELVRRERKSWVHIVGRAPQIAGAAAIPTTTSNPFQPTSKTTTIRPSRAATTTAATTTRAVATATSDTAKVLDSTSAITTSAPVATTSATRIASTKPARITSDTPSSSSTRTSSASSSSVTAVPVSASSKAKSGTSTGTVVAIVVVVIVVVGLIGAFFGWRKYKANRAARGSGTGLVAGGGSFRRHKEEADDVYGNQSAGSGYDSNAEKNYGSTGGYGALGINPQHVYQAQGNQGGAAAFAGDDAAAGAGMAGMGARGQQQQQHQSRDTPSSGFGTPPPSSYPPSSSGSTTHLLNNNEQRSSYADNQPAYVPMPTVVETPPPAPKSPFGDAPGEGKIYIVRNTFVPSQPDELVVYPDDRIQVLVAYDDGWALGINLDAADKTPKKGVFPFDCVTELAPSPNAHQVELSATAPASSQFPSSSQPSQTLPHQQPEPLPSPQEQPRQLTPLPEVEQSSSSGFPDYSQPAPQMGPPQLAPLRSDSPLFAPHQLSGSPAPSNVGLPSSLQVGNRDGDKGNRTSSLIASRDAELFLALGNQFDQQDQRAA